MRKLASLKRNSVFNYSAKNVNILAQIGGKIEARKTMQRVCRLKCGRNRVVTFIEELEVNADMKKRKRGGN